MAKTAIQLTDQELAVYRAAAREREARERRQLAQRAERARMLAQRAATLLKAEFGATRVVLFGSLARGDFFHRRSDVDLAVEGIEAADFWRAWGALDRLGHEFEINLVDLKETTPALGREIDREGVDL